MALPSSDLTAYTKSCHTLFSVLVSRRPQRIYSAKAIYVHRCCVVCLI